MTTPTGSTHTTTGTTAGTTTGATAGTTYPQVTRHGRSGGTFNTAETKPAFKTTELVFYVLAVVGVLIATEVVDGFRANQGWLYVTMLTIGYMISRGLAKAGSYAKDNDPRTDAYPDGR